MQKKKKAEHREIIKPRVRTVETLLIAGAMVLVVMLAWHFVPGQQKFYPLKEANGKVVIDAQHLADEYEQALPEVAPIPGVNHAAHPPAATRVAAKEALPSRVLHVSVLMYHHIGDVPSDADGIRRDLTVSTADFAAQVAWLKSAGYTSLTLQQVYEASQGQYQLPAKSVVFTFDDGYKDVFINAVPILKQYGMVGSFAVVPGFFGHPDYTSWAEVVAARQEGMEILSHTYDHFDGSSTKYNQQDIQENLEKSLAELDAHLGRVPRILVYPYGHYTDNYIVAAKEVGFTMALTTKFGRFVDPDNLMATPRVRVHGGQSLDRFIEVLTGKKEIK